MNPVTRGLSILLAALAVLSAQACTSVDATGSSATELPAHLSAEQIDALLDEGQKAIDEGRHDEAVRPLGRALGAAPDDPRLNFEMGVCFLAMGEEFAADPELGGDPGAAFYDSESYFRKTLEHDPLHGQAGVLLARSLYMNGRLIEARAPLEAHLERHPRDGAARLLAGHILLATYAAAGESAAVCVDEAITHLSHAVEIDPAQPAAHTALGDCFLHKGDADAALAVYQKGIVQCIENAELHQRLVTCFRGSEAFTPAEALVFYEALLARPDQTSVALGMLHWFQGVWYDALGRSEYEKEDFEKAAGAYALCAASYNRCGRIHEPFAPEALYEEAQAFSNVGWAHYYGGAYDLAEQLFCKALTLRQDLKNAVLGIDYLGAAVTNRDGMVDGRNFFRRVATAHPWNSKWWNNYALFCRETGQNEQAYTGYTRAMTLAPDDTRYINDCGMMLLYYLDREPEKAEEFFARAWKTGEARCADPLISDEDRKYHFDAYCDAMLNLGRLMLIQNRIEEAAPIAESLGRKAPLRPDVQELLRGLERTRKGIPYELPE